MCPLRLQGPCDGAALRASADVTGVPELRPQHSWVDDAAVFEEEPTPQRPPAKRKRLPHINLFLEAGYSRSLKWTCREANDASRPRGCDVCRPARLGNERCWLSLSKRDATFALPQRTYVPSGEWPNTRQTSLNGHDAALKLGGMNSKRKPPPYSRRSPTSRRFRRLHDAPLRSQREA